MKSITNSVLLLLLLLVCRGEDWPQWRGPHFNGASNGKGLPDKFSKESAKWSVDLPGPGAATPVVVGNRVFVSSTDASAQTLQAMCLDADSGKVLWNNKAGDGIRRDDRSNFAAPSPVADKEYVYFFYS